MTPVVHPVPGNHAALFYEREQVLHASVAAFLAPAMLKGEPAVMIARQRTFEAVADRLAPTYAFTSDDIDARVMFLDARSAMRTFMDDARLDLQRVEQAFVDLLAQVRQRHATGTIRLYGEVVDLLCEQANHAAALGIEELWNARFAGPQVSVLCGYSTRHFGDDGSSVTRLRAVCGQHMQIIPHAFLQNRTSAQTGRTVYIVEDDDNVRRALERLLRMYDLRIRSFASAESFLTSVGEPATGCAIIDAQLPGMSGLDLQRWLVDAGWMLPVIVMSGSMNPQIARDALHLGASVYLPKPLEADALVAAVTNALRAVHPN